MAFLLTVPSICLSGLNAWGVKLCCLEIYHISLQVIRVLWKVLNFSRTWHYFSYPWLAVAKWFQTSQLPKGFHLGVLWCRSEDLFEKDGLLRKPTGWYTSTPCYYKGLLWFDNILPRHAAHCRRVLAHQWHRGVVKGCGFSARFFKGKGGKTVKYLETGVVSSGVQDWCKHDSTCVFYQSIIKRIQGEWWFLQVL